jgi:hypothetical protein
VFVDVAGDRDVLHAVHTRLGDQLAHSMTVGNTHWDHRAEASAPLPGPEPQFFFAPGQIAKRITEWGPDGLDARVSEAWGSYADWVDSWIELRHGAGPDAVGAAYLELLDGRADPRVGFICTMAAAAADDRSAS